MEVLDEAGITVDPKAVANGKFSRTDGYAAVMQMARSGLLKPGEGALYDGKGIDSIIALNDVMAIGAMTALRANGIEPGREIGVTGFGDIPYSADVFPPLTPCICRWPKWARPPWTASCPTAMTGRPPAALPTA